MAKRKIKLTRTELKAQRDALARYERYLPTLKLKQQQVQSSIVQMRQMQRQVRANADDARRHIESYLQVFNDMAGINVHQLARPDQVQTTTQSIAGVKVPVFQKVTFSHPDYSLFSTAPWVDRAVGDLRQFNRFKVELEILDTCVELLQNELKKVMQRVNLFEKIKIPQTQDNIRRIRIAIGDQMTASVARAKIAKNKLELKEQLAREAVVQ